jgi:hypothetical protein
MLLTLLESTQLASEATVRTILVPSNSPVPRRCRMRCVIAESGTVNHMVP